LNLIFFGPPGAGKGTQASLLAESGDYNHISTGELFRQSISQDTELGREAKAYLDKGELVPDEITIGLVRNLLIDMAGKSWILDGFPRTIPQAEALDRLMEDLNIRSPRAVFFEVPKSVLIKRLTGRRGCPSCGALYNVYFSPPKVEGLCDRCGSALSQRKDDSEDVIGARLREYDKKTAPLKDYFETKNRIILVNADGPKDVVREELGKALDS